MNKFSWREVVLGEVLTRSEEWIDIEPEEKYQEVTVRLWGRGVTRRRDVRGSEIAATSRLKVRAGQFILSRIDARNGAFGLVPDSLDGAIVSNDFPVFTPNPSRLLSSFLNWMSKTRGFVDICKAASEGTTNRVRLKEDRFLKTKILLPALSEQRRIVARIEALAAKIEEAKSLRQLAIEETDLLSSIASSSPLSNSKWPYHTIEELVGRSNLKNGKSIKTTDQPSEIRCLTLSSMRNGRINCADSKPIDITLADAKPYLARTGDVFIVRGNGSKDLVGRAGIVGAECKGVIFPDLFIRVPLNSNKILGEFFVSAWNSKRMRDIIIEKAKTTSGIWKINQGHIASFSIPVPSIDEQRSVVTYLDNLWTRINALKHLQAETAIELDALMPAILDRAFKGEL